MFSPLRNRFGIPGVISVIALVFAMLGGAYAANNSSDNGKATASAKAKKGPRGPKGATGPAGPAGLSGPAGAKGDRGEVGANGANGAPGESVKLSAATACSEGGTKLTVGASSTNVCNGEEGLQGEPGEPWTAGGTLPGGATETGNYVISSETGKGLYVGFAVGSISFPIPLAAGLPESNTIYVPELPAPLNCENPDHPGPASVSNPEAKSGYLCVYKGSAFNLESSTLEFLAPTLNSAGAYPSGTLILQAPTQEAAEDGLPAWGAGTWAVTAP